MTRLNVFAAFLLFVGACEDGTSSPSLGIYEITSWTSNEGGCDNEGASILAAEEASHFVISQNETFGPMVLNYDRHACLDVEECRTKLLDDEVSLGSEIFGSGEGLWKGGGASYVADDTSCVRAEIREHLLVESSDESVRVETRRTRVENVPLNDDGGCDKDEAQILAKESPCSSYEVVVGRLISELPQR